MADENNGADSAAETEAAGEPAGEDRVKNLQAETSRKINDLYAQLAKRDQQVEQLVQTLQTRQPAAANSAAKPISELIYDDPAAAVSQIAQQVGEQVEQRVSTKMAAQSEFSQTAASLEAEYPEFRDRTSEHFARVKKYHDEQPANIRGTSVALENAAYKAARDFGLIPSSKRKQTQNEDFSLAGSQSSTRQRRNNDDSGEMSQSQAAFAELLGANSKDPKFKEVFKKANSRKNWTSYQGDD